ncbi:hypothetical protein BDQ17DRAFT_1333512 [Cyathus striatus]|nr:hypothetical protein BDQ17DRAFT_1333512 [Cyathus striatus]
MSSPSYNAPHGSQNYEPTLDTLGSSPWWPQAFANTFSTKGRIAYIPGLPPAYWGISMLHPPLLCPIQDPIDPQPLRSHGAPGLQHLVIYNAGMSRNIRERGDQITFASPCQGCTIRHGETR